MVPLTRIEEIILLSVWRLQGDAYGLAIRRHATELLNQQLSVSAVYIPLERLKKRGLLRSWESSPTEKRGGRRKRFFAITKDGWQALNQLRHMQQKAWDNLPPLAFED